MLATVEVPVTSQESVRAVKQMQALIESAQQLVTSGAEQSQVRLTKHV